MAVYVTQVPSRIDKDRKWIPTVDLAPAATYGELKILLPSGMNFHAAAPAVEQMRADLRAFRPTEDYFLPLGDPLVMAAAAAILGRTQSHFKMLKWDRRAHCYHEYTVELG